MPKFKETPVLSTEDQALFKKYDINGSLDLSKNMRMLRVRQGLKSRKVADRMGLHNSVPSLWERGKRLVPLKRIRPLAEALEASVEELIGVNQAEQLDQPITQVVAGEAGSGVKEPPVRRRIVADDFRPTEWTADSIEIGPRERVIVSRGLPTVLSKPTTPSLPSRSEPKPWLVAERPPLIGRIPEGWLASDRIQDISPELPDGYWLDPVKVEKDSMRNLLASRLLTKDQIQIEGYDVPGAVIAERIYTTRREDLEFIAGNLPLAEAIFRLTLVAEYGGLTDGAIVELLQEKGRSTPVSSILLRRMREIVRPYPIQRVDAEFFKGYR